MRTAAYLALSLATAFAVEDTTPPVISLDLSGNVDSITNSDADVSTHNKASYAKRCEVCLPDTPASTCAKNCPEPTATAYDHHDGDISEKIVATYNLFVKSAKNTAPVQVNQVVRSIDYKLRGESVINYNVRDNSDNAAETLVFAMIMVDTTAPTITYTGSFATGDGHEASKFTRPVCPSKSHLIRFSSYSVVDNYDFGGPLMATLSLHSSSSSSVTGYSSSSGVSGYRFSSVGTHTVVVTANDFANIFGTNNANNVARDSITFGFDDSKPPAFETPDNVARSVTHECNTALSSAQFQSTCFDCVDGAVTPTYSYSINSQNPFKDMVKTPGTYTQTANCKDSSNNQADAATATITVVDTTAPTLRLVPQVHVYEHLAGETTNLVEQNASGHVEYSWRDLTATMWRCNDRCDGDITQLCQGSPKRGCVDTNWQFENSDGNMVDVNEFSINQVGKYELTYTCIDNKGIPATEKRTIINVDRTHPKLDMLGDDVITFEATRTGNYVDDGATCSDVIDGEISQQVEVSGAVVNLAKTGEYEIHYDCKDSAGNSAPRLTRTVVVQDTTCPVCQLEGDTNKTIEASFPYTDAGATCTDSLTQNPRQWRIGSVNVEQTGTYFITFGAVDEEGLNSTSCATNTSYIRKVVVVDTLKPVIALKYNSQIIQQGPSAESDLDNYDSVTAQAHLQTHLNAFTAGLMAEETTTSAVNGWVLGAIASAVSGLALLAFSLRRQTTEMSVPV